MLCCMLYICVCRLQNPFSPSTCFNPALQPSIMTKCYSQYRAQYCQIAINWMQLVIAEITRVLIVLAKGVGECKQTDPMKLMNHVRRT